MRTFLKKTERKTLILIQINFETTIFLALELWISYLYCYECQASVDSAPVAAESCYQAIIYFTVLR